MSGCEILKILLLTKMWHLSSGGMNKSNFEALANLFDSRHIAGAIFGNRFKAILVKV
jgi:hypothetical protein